MGPRLVGDRPVGARTAPPAPVVVAVVLMAVLALLAASSLVTALLSLAYAQSAGLLAPVVVGAALACAAAGGWVVCIVANLRGRRWGRVLASVLTALTVPGSVSALAQPVNWSTPLALLGLVACVAVVVLVHLPRVRSSYGERAGRAELA